MTQISAEYPAPRSNSDILRKTLQPHNYGILASNHKLLNLHHMIKLQSQVNCRNYPDKKHRQRAIKKN